jgi:hypothetical protein
MLSVDDISWCGLVRAVVNGLTGVWKQVVVAECDIPRRQFDGECEESHEHEAGIAGVQADISTLDRAEYGPDSEVR